MQARGNFLYLLVSLLLFLGFLAVLHQYPHIGGGNLISIAFVFSLVIAIWSLVKERLWLMAGIALAGIAAITAALQIFFVSEWLVEINLVAVFVFYMMSTAIAFMALIRSSTIDMNKIVGSVCVYLLAGINWGFLYYFAERLQGGSFDGFTSTDTGGDLFALIYYSYVTLSTLGYGDITPIRPIVQVLAVIEALFGQFYIAILVAILVGTHISNHKGDRRDRTD